MPLRLHAVASRSFDLEPDAINAATGTTLLGSTFTDPAVRASFSRRPHSGRLRQYTLDGAVFDTTVCTMHIHGSLIDETAYLTDPHERQEPNERVDKVLNADAAHQPIIGFNRAWTNYYHWTAQALPAIDNAIRACQGARPLCILPQIGPRQEQSLRLLGHAHARYVSVAPHQRVQISTCQYSDLLNGAAAFSVSVAARHTFDRLLSAATADLPAAPLIYIARTDSEHRRMENEAALVERLEGMGFRIVLPGTLSVEEQIVMFRGARAVVGPHGAGMTNVAFCQPGTLVYELMPRFYPNPCMDVLAQGGSLIYAADLFEGEGTMDTQLHGAWTVDVPRVEARLRELLDLVA